MILSHLDFHAHLSFTILMIREEMFHNVTSAFNQDQLIALVIYVTFVQKVQKIRDFFFLKIKHTNYLFHVGVFVTSSFIFSRIHQFHIVSRLNDVIVFLCHCHCFVS